MNAQPDYASWAVAQYLEQQAEAEAERDRLNKQIATELRSRETWELGMAEASIEQVGRPNPILDALISGDELEAGRLIRKYITTVYAKDQAEVAIHRQDEDAANDFAIG
jgi:hypothetical protein